MDPVFSEVASENAPRTLLFVDMLGFAALTRKFPNRWNETGPDADGFEYTGPTPTHHRFNRFQGVLEHAVREGRLTGGIRAMLFSDCAFLDLETSLRAALFAATMMRHFLHSSVPVRMGLGHGTFHQLNFSMESEGATVITQSRFMGTAVVHAHAAEQSGGKGMRIFLHPSLESELGEIRQRLRILDLPKRLKNASWELDYLEDEDNSSRMNPKPSILLKGNYGLYESVANMRDPKAPAAVKKQYGETLAALNRMCAARGTSGINLRKLKGDKSAVDF